MKNRSRGFGLVEIMVALVLGLIVSLGVIQIFIASRGTFVTQNTSARMQEEARFVLSKMMQEIRMTGMYGCLAFDTAVVAPAIIPPPALNSPILWDSASKTLTVISADVGNASSAPTWTIISDCQKNSRVYAGARVPAAGQTAFPLRQLAYSFDGSTLSLKVGGAAPQPLLQNVKKLDVSFGMAGPTLSYSTGSITAGNSEDVRSVRLTLILTDPDGRVRDQEYNVVAQLRNSISASVSK